MLNDTTTIFNKEVYNKLREVSKEIMKFPLDKFVSNVLPEKLLRLESYLNLREYRVTLDEKKLQEALNQAIIDLTILRGLVIRLICP